MEAIVTVFIISPVVTAVALMYSLLRAEKTKPSSTAGNRSFASSNFKIKS